MLSQVRHFSLTETIKLKCQKFQNYQSSLVRSSVNESVNVNYKIDFNKSTKSFDDRIKN
jgi:hypothetical protein